MTKILYCQCQHAFQDWLYGVSRRVHNELKKTTSSQKYRCTVCDTVKEG